MPCTLHPRPFEPSGPRSATGSSTSYRLLSPGLWRPGGAAGPEAVQGSASFWPFKGGYGWGSFKGDTAIDVDVEVNVDIDSYLGWFKGAFKVSSGTVEGYRSSDGTDFDSSEIAGPVAISYIAEVPLTRLITCRKS